MANQLQMQKQPNSLQQWLHKFLLNCLLSCARADTVLLHRSSRMCSVWMAGAALWPAPGELAWKRGYVSMLFAFVEQSTTRFMCDSLTCHVLWKGVFLSTSDGGISWNEQQTHVPLVYPGALSKLALPQTAGLPAALTSIIQANFYFFFMFPNRGLCSVFSGSVSHRQWSDYVSLAMKLCFCVSIFFLHLLYTHKLDNLSESVPLLNVCAVIATT